jgi:signal transduction histidine kinase
MPADTLGSAWAPASVPPAWRRLGRAIVLPVLGLVEAALLGLLFRQRRWRSERVPSALRFDEILSELNTRFSHLTAAEVSTESVRSLGAVGEYLGVDRATLMAPDKTSGVFRVRGWARDGVQPGPAVVSVGQFPWASARLRRGEIVRFARREDLPDAAVVDRETFRSIGVRSFIAIPLVADGLMVGSVSFATVSHERTWPDGLVARLQLLAEVFANVLARRRVDEALRQSRALSVAVVESLPGKVMVLDRAGLIIATNDPPAAEADDTDSAAHLTIGVDYLARWRQCVADGHRAAADVLHGVQAVLEGRLPQFSIEYLRPHDERWLEFRVQPLRTEAGGAVVSRIDITERKLAEVEARQARDELARVGRMATVGQLTAALAHEVKQPLTGILTNAQVARRLLAGETPDLAEIRAILDDIIQDDQRAASVIQRLRTMLKRDEPERVATDVNQLIRDVARFLHTDALMRSATIALDLAPELPTIHGDPVQLQQVLVNLVLNGLDAMKGVLADHRRLLVRTEWTGAAVCVAVRDAGTGLGSNGRDRLFEPFYTTKSEGMGLGLPIARSIVEAQGGRLWAADNEAQGATFFFTLPVDGGVGHPVLARRWGAQRITASR